jgi:hypothetical protein
LGSSSPSSSYGVPLRRRRSRAVKLMRRIRSTSSAREGGVFRHGRWAL